MFIHTLCNYDIVIAISLSLALHQLQLHSYTKQLLIEQEDNGYKTEDTYQNLVTSDVVVPAPHRKPPLLSLLKLEWHAVLVIASTPTS